MPVWQGFPDVPFKAHPLAPTPLDTSPLPANPSLFYLSSLGAQMPHGKRISGGHCSVCCFLRCRLVHELNYVSEVGGVSHFTGSIMP